MKKLLMIFSFLTVSVTSYAQENNKKEFNSEKRATHVVESLKDTLELSENQVSSLKESYIMLFNTQQSIRQSSAREGNEMKKALNEHLVRVQEILQDDQKYETYSKIKTTPLKNRHSTGANRGLENKEQHVKRSPEERAFKIADRKVLYLSDTLQLNEGEKQALREVFAKQALAKMETREAAKAERKERKEQTNEAVKQILQSEEKFKLYNELQSDRLSDKQKGKRKGEKRFKNKKKRDR